MMFCGQCGTPLDPQARFCSECGTPHGMLQSREARPKSRALLLWGIGATMAILLVIAVGVGINGSGVSVVPTPTPIPVAVLERNLVTSYYSDITSGNLRSAYSRLAQAYRKDLTFESWATYHDSTISASPSNLTVANGEVSFRLREQDKTDAGALTSVFDETWHITKGKSGKLSLDDPHPALLYTSYFLSNHTDQRR